MNLSQYGKKILWVDTETTGVDTQHDDIIQVAGFIKIPDSNPSIITSALSSFNLLFQPAEMDLEAATESQLAALAISGNTVDGLKEATDNQSAFNKFKQWLERHVNRFNKADKLLVAGYNIRFDTDMIRTWWNKRGDKWYGSYFYPYTLDVLSDVVRYIMHLPADVPRPENLKLGTVLEWLDIEVEGELHDAMTDIKATELLYNKLVVLQREQHKLMEEE